MTLADDAHEEVRELHEFFEAWFRDDLPETAFDHPESSLADDFRMVPPSGQETSRDPVLASIREGRGSEVDSDPAFEIDIRDLRTLAEFPDHCQVTYEEWQRSDGEWVGRRSTALFRRATDAPNGVEWVDLHETFIDG